MTVQRLFTEKKAGFDVHARKTETKIRNILGLRTNIRYFIRYDVEGIGEDELKKAETTIFSEPPVDNLRRENLPNLDGYTLIGIEFLPGQYDQRADSAAQCLQLLTLGAKPEVRCASIYAVKILPEQGINENEDNSKNSHKNAQKQSENQNESAGNSTLNNQEDIDRIIKLLVNPVECRLCVLDKPSDLHFVAEPPKKVGRIDGFTSFSSEQIRAFHASEGFAMSEEDLLFVRDYFNSEKRDPTETELKVIDTYWSDHCRHTTFFTRLSDIEIESDNPHIKAALDTYNNLYKKHNFGRDDKYPCLMDMATIGAKELKSAGKLKDVDESEEINACSINVSAEVDGKNEDWLVMFKNETHNHPTEIEPYGGAATCLGGAIRDPLSGRAYVYQAMRVSGAGDINQNISEGLKGKLPQRVISSSAAAGFSSYGNQIGLATGLVHEFAHEGFAAKRMEVGFVVAAAKKENVIRERPKAGDIVLLIGGDTGRDGCGGATGSSKAHDADSIENCGAEVQKGNPLTERKLQRLFRNPAFSKLIKRCNDFGAGGVSVAIGELSDALDIQLENVPKKYYGLNATELAISESQERMAVVVSPDSFERIKELCGDENVAVTKVANVTDTGRMIMRYEGDEVVNLSRDFLNTNGAKQSINAKISEKATNYLDRLSAKEQSLFDKVDYKSLLKEILSKSSVCSQKGLIEMFDSTIGAGTVLMPLGGKYQLSPSISMAAKLPIADTETATVAAFGYNPHLMSESCFIGAIYSVLESVIKTVITGADYDSIYLSFQEYFEKLRKEPARWGKPTSAILGALKAQLELGLGAIGGKDSMSGSFENIDVPPSLISFALGVASAGDVISNSLAAENKRLYRYSLERDEFSMPNLRKTSEFLRVLSKHIKSGDVDFATIVLEGGAAAAIIKSALGNGLGVRFSRANKDMFTPRIGDIIISVKNEEKSQNLLKELELIAETTAGERFEFGADSKGEANVPFKKACQQGTESGACEFRGREGIENLSITLAEAVASFTRTFENAYPTVIASAGEQAASKMDFYDKRIIFSKNRIARPRVLIPAFPGTNCEFDTARKFSEAGAETDIFIIKNLNCSDIVESVRELERRIKNSNIIAFPGGFSGGDEPDGSGKFIATTFRNALLADAVHELLYNRDGLCIGICNGFQALIKLGLLPKGRIAPMREDSATLTFNNISRHVSQMAYIKVMSTMSPWLSGVKTGEVYSVAVSHGEGRFVASEGEIRELVRNGQIATRYVDLSGKETMEFPFNPNGSKEAIEGIFSVDGRVLGKMGHSERSGKNLFKNVIAPSDMNIFSSGIKYYK